MPTGASEVRAGGAFVEIGGRLTKLDSALALARKKMQAFGKNVMTLGKSFSKLGAVMSLPMIAGIKIATDFGEQMASVSTMIDQSQLTKFMPSFRREMRKMSVEFGEGTDTISKGLYDILSASIAPSKAIGVLRVSMKAAKAGMTDTGTAADAITTILNSYGLAADQATSVSDLLFATVKRGKTTFAELAPAVGMVASTASVAGLSMEEMAAALATGTRNGVRTRISVTALNSTLMTFLKPTTKAAKAAKSFGFELNTNTLRTIGLIGVIKKMQGATAEQIASVFENRRALKLIMPVIQDLAGFTVDLELAQKRGGLTQEAYAKMAGILMHAFRKLKQSVIDLLRTIGISLEKRTMAWVESIIKLVDAVKTWITQNPKLIASYANLAIRLLTLGIALMVVGKGITTIAKLLSPGGLFAIGIGSILYFSGFLDDSTKKWLDWVRELKMGSSAVGEVFNNLKVLWKELAPLWRSGLTFLGASWEKFAAGMKVNFLKMLKSLLYALSETIGGMADKLLEMSKTIGMDMIIRKLLKAQGKSLAKVSIGLTIGGIKLLPKIKSATKDLEAATKNVADAWKKVGEDAEGAREKISAFAKKTIDDVMAPPIEEKGGPSLIRAIMDRYPQVLQDALEAANAAYANAKRTATGQNKSMDEVTKTSADAFTKRYASYLKEVEAGWIASTDKMRGIQRGGVGEKTLAGGKALGTGTGEVIGTFRGALASLMTGGTRIEQDQLNALEDIRDSSKKTADKIGDAGALTA